MYPDVKKWQARRESNPQPAVLETAALPIELLACTETTQCTFYTTSAHHKGAPNTRGLTR